MVPEVLYRVCYGTPRPTPFQASLLTFHPAILPGYIRRKVRFCDYPGITPAPPPASVRGTYVNGLTDGDFWRLEIFEGSEYERRKVKVRLLVRDIRDSSGQAGELSNVEKYVEGEELETETYVFTADEASLEEGEWDLADFKRSKLRRWVGEHEEYEGEWESRREALLGPTHLLMAGESIELLTTIEVDGAVKAIGTP
jgi:hypothetical protein